MEVQHIHLHCGHTVEIALEHVERNKVAADIDQQSPPGKPRLIPDRDHRHSKSTGSGLNQLQERLQSIQRSEWRGRSKLSARFTDHQLIGLVLTQLLSFLASMLRTNLERRVRRIVSPLQEANACKLR